MRQYRTCPKGPPRLIRFEQSVDAFIRHQSDAAGKSAALWLDDLVKARMAAPLEAVNETPDALSTVQPTTP